jgi:toxin ParE1/3/4
MRRYFLSRLADEDISAIWNYIARDNPSAADRIVDRFTETFERLAEFPESGERYSHPQGELRRSIVSPYLIFFRLSDDQIEIVRVLHGSRRWEDLL